MSSTDLLQYYRRKLDDLPDFSLVLDRIGTILFANRRYLELRGTSLAELVGHSILEFLDEDEIPEVEALIANQNAFVASELRLRCKVQDGAGMRYVRWKFVEIPTQDMSLVLVWGDFTARHEPGTEMGFTILPNGIIQAVSPALCALCGYAQDELVGFAARQFYFSPSARRRVVSQLLERNEVENGHVTLRCKDGSPLSLGYSAQTIKDKEGRIRAYCGYFLRREFLFSSKLAHEFSKIVDALPGIAWVSGRDHRIVYANDNYLDAYEVRREQVIGRTEYDFLHQDAARILTEAALKVFEDKQELIHPAVPHLPDPQRWLRVIRRPIFDDNKDDVIGLLGICQDISAQVLRENAFMEAIKAYATDVVVVTDNQGRILRRSIQTLTPTIYGRPALHETYTLDMRPILDLLHADDLPVVRRAMHLVLCEHQEQQLECRIRNQTGNYSQVFARLLYNDSIYGEPRMYVVARDISDLAALRRPEKVLERLKKAVSARTDRELAVFLNVSAASISNARKNERIPADWLIDAGRRSGYSIDWIVSGIGPENSMARTLSPPVEAAREQEYPDHNRSDTEKKI